MQSRCKPVAGSVRYEWTGTMCVCWSLARVWGSREPVRATFSATGRSASCRSWARKTRANEPRPSSSTRWKPAIVWPASGKGVSSGPGTWRSVEAALPTSSWMSKTRRSRSREVGEPLVVLGGEGGLAVLLAAAELLVAEGDHRLGVEAGEAVAIFLDPDRLAVVPPQVEVGAEQREPGGGAGRRPRGGSRAGSGRSLRLRRGSRQASSKRRASRVAAGDDASSHVPDRAIEPILVQPSVKTRRRNSSSTR